MGDNRDNSIDSRSDQIGMICSNDVVGRAWLRYWPINTVGILQTPTLPDARPRRPNPPEEVARQLDSCSPNWCRADLTAGHALALVPTTEMCVRHGITSRPIVWQPTF